jgi:DNA-binding NtrC family response regulator
VLFVSPHREDATVLSRMLSSLPVPLEHVADVQRARVAIQADSHQVILTEATLPDGTWRDILDIVRVVKPAPAVIVTDASADARFWAEALNLGAYDLIAQPFATAEVRRILSYACSRLSDKSRAAAAAV